MRTNVLTALLSLAPVLALSQTAAPPPAVPAAPAIVPAAATDAPSSASSSGAKLWIGREAEVEEFLRSAKIEKIEKVPVGVTKPEKALFELGGIARAAAVKHLPSGNRNGFWESYGSEIAAYELDRLLGLGMVPVTIERRVGSDKASVQMWVENCKLLKDVRQAECPRQGEWAKQVCRQRMFDNLIANIDRNQGNLLVDAEWNLILIDHSRAFAADRMPFEKEMARIDKEMFARLKALDQASLETHLRRWLIGEGSIRELLRRRDKIVARFEQLASQRGEAAVFPW